jgi:hypothetical protein
MQWPNPNGSITEGVVIEDGNGNKITAAVPFYVAPGTGVTWTLGGELPAFAETPTFNIGTAPTLAVNWSEQSVAATQSGTWNIGSVSSLPALASGSNTIGAVTQAGGPWTINYTQISGATLGAATAWGAAPSGNVQGVNANVLALPALPAGSNTVGNVGVNNNPVGSASLATSRASIGATAAQIVAARTGAPGTGRIAVTLYNFGSATVFYGASGVTATTGMPLPAGAVATLNTTAAIYGIAASGTQTLGVMETF